MTHRWPLSTRRSVAAAVRELRDPLRSSPFLDRSWVDEWRALPLWGDPEGVVVAREDGRFLEVDRETGEVFPLAADSPRVVRALVHAARELPALTEALPARPPHASVCEPCRGAGELVERGACEACGGLGWAAAA